MSSEPCAVEWCDRPVGDGYMMTKLSDQRGTMNEAGRCINTPRPLTHSLDLSKEGLAMKATRTCSVVDCEKPVKTLKSGMCGMHVSRLDRTGTTDLRPYDHQAATERFWSKVDKTATCWLYGGTILSSGYGQFKVQYRVYMAHRYAYEVSVGPIPDGLTLDHVKDRGCAHLNCVNPAHLEPVTQVENLRRSGAVSAVNSRKTECPTCGSAYSVDGNDQRFCKPCRAAWKRRAAK